MESRSDGWKYNYVYISRSEAIDEIERCNQLRFQCNDMGGDGWELVSVQSTEDYDVAWLKKRYMT